MSYDIRFAVKVAGAADDVYAVIGEPERSSPTYNLGTMFRRCMDWDFKQSEWYPLQDVIPKVERGLHELRFNPAKYRQYEPDNGWGTIGSAIEALQSILTWCADEWRRGWNGDIPLDCIYMAW